MTDLELMHKIVCEKGMTLTIMSPIWLLDYGLNDSDDVLVMLSKNEKYAYTIIRLCKEMPTSEIRDIVESLIKELEGELDDGSV